MGSVQDYLDRKKQIAQGELAGRLRKKLADLRCHMMPLNGYKKNLGENS